MIAKDGELPAGLSRTEWKQLTGGLLLTAALVVVLTLAFDLSGIAMMGSAAFLLVYAAVNAGHLRVLKQTGANAVDRLAVAAHVPGDVRDAVPSTPTSSSRRRSRRSSSSRSRRLSPNGCTGAGPGERSRKTSRSIFRKRACPGLDHKRVCSISPRSVSALTSSTLYGWDTDLAVTPRSGNQYCPSHCPGGHCPDASSPCLSDTGHASISNVKTCS